MANVRLVFSGTERSSTFEDELECYATKHNEILLNIKDLASDTEVFMCLDKTTAIRFHRELKKQISFLIEEEVNNG
jgi:hypothetical protein